MITRGGLALLYGFHGLAQAYVLGGLLKLFGQSLPVERFLDLHFRVLVVYVYVIVSTYFCRAITAYSSATLDWRF